MQKLSILIVEDEAILAMRTRAALIHLGHQTAGIAASGEEALRLFKQLETIDLVLMDIQLAGEWDGIDTAGKLSTVRAVPVIFLTAYADEQTLQRAKIENMVGYIVKPFQEKDLRAAIEMGVYQFQQMRSRYAQYEAFSDQRTKKEGTEVSQGKSQDEIQDKSQMKETDDKRIVVMEHDTMHVLQAADIYYLEVKAGMIDIHLVQQIISTRGTLNEWQERLENLGFYRSHRAFLVNLAKIKKIAVWMDHAYVIRLKDKEDAVPLSRYRVQQLRELMLSN